MTRPAVVSDPVRRAEFLDLVRAQPGISVAELADAMRLSKSCIGDLIRSFVAAGKVDTDYVTAKRDLSLRAHIKMVVRIAKRKPRIGKRPLIEGAGFRRPLADARVAPLVADWPYAYTGSPVGPGDHVLRFQVWNKMLPEDGRRNV